jgi:hypothetical protein
MKLAKVNLNGLILLIKRKKLLSTGTRRMYIYLFIIDTIQIDFRFT